MADVRPAQTLKATQLGAQLLAAATRQAAVNTHIQARAAELYQAPGGPGPGPGPQGPVASPGKAQARP